MTFVDDVGHIWKLWSVRVAAAGALITGTWLALPAEIKDMLPKEWEPFVAVAFFVLTILARSLKQKRKPDGKL